MACHTGHDICSGTLPHYLSCRPNYVMPWGTGVRYFIYLLYFFFWTLAFKSTINNLDLTESGGQIHVQNRKVVNSPRQCWVHTFFYCQFMSIFLAKIFDDFSWFISVFGNIEFFSGLKGLVFWKVNENDSNPDLFWVWLEKLNKLSERNYRLRII